MPRVPLLACAVALFALLAAPPASAYTLIVSPTTLAADTGSSSPVTICLKDASGAGQSGISLNWTNYSGGSATVAGSSGVQGTITTGTGGCIQAAVAANSVPPNQVANYIAFAAPTSFAVAPAKLALTATWSLQIVPRTLVGNGTQPVTATLSSGNGTPQPNVLLQLTCQGSGGVLVAVANPSVATDSTGRAAFSLTPSGAIGFNTTPASATCSVSSAYSGAVAAATLTAQGLDVCALGYLPQPPQCGDPAP